MRAMEDMIELQVENGATMGDFCRSPSVATNMAVAISDMILQDLKDSLLISDAPLSLIADGSSGVDGTHYVSVIFQFVGKQIINLEWN